MVFYNLYVFDKHTSCVIYREWVRPRRNRSMPLEQEFKLTYGMTHSCRGLLRKMMHPKLESLAHHVDLSALASNASLVNSNQTGEKENARLPNKVSSLPITGNTGLNLNLSANQSMSLSSLTSSALLGGVSPTTPATRTLAGPVLNPLSPRATSFIGSNFSPSSTTSQPQTDDSYFVIRADRYHMHVFQTPTDVKFVLNTSPDPYDFTLLPSSNTNILNKGLATLNLTGANFQSSGLSPGILGGGVTKVNVSNQFKSTVPQPPSQNFGAPPNTNALPDMKALLMRIYAQVYVPYYISVPLYGVTFQRKFASRPISPIGLKQAPSNFPLLSNGHYHHPLMNDAGESASFKENESQSGVYDPYLPPTPVTKATKGGGVGTRYQALNCPILLDALDRLMESLGVKVVPGPTSTLTPATAVIRTI